MASKKTFEVQANLSLIDKITQPLSKIQASIEVFSRKASRKLNSISRPLDKLSTGMRRTAVDISAAVTGMIFGLSKFLKVGAEFEQSIVNASVKFPGGIERGTIAFEELEKAARKVGKETRFTASEAAQAFDFLAMSGFSANQAIASLPGIVDLATVANTDLATATDMVSDSLSIMGLMTEDSEQLQKNLARASGVMIKASNSANFSFSQLFESFTAAGPVAKAAGIEMEELSGLLAVLANNGIKGSRAGTSMLNVISRLQAPSLGARRALKRLGVEVFDSNKQMRSMVDIIEDMRKGATKLSGKALSGTLNKVFGLQALPAANVLLGSTDAELRKLIESFGDVDGVVEKAAATINDTLKGDLLSLSSAFSDVLIQMKNMIDSPLRESIQKLTEEIRENGVAIAEKLGFAIIKLIELMIKLIENFETVVKWVKRLGIAFLALRGITLILAASAAVIASPWLALSAVLVGIVATIGTIGIKWSQIRKFFGIKTKLPEEDEQDTSRISSLPVTPLNLIQSRELMGLGIGKFSGSNTQQSTITIKDESGKAEITESNMGNNLAMIPTGAF